jgi:RHS repeat-associated protein
VTNDGSHTYSYDSEGRPTTVDGVQIAYDAFNRPVIQNRSGVYTEIVYAPTGQKFALMNGQTVKQYFVPMAGGLQAVFNGSGLQYYRHADWLGSSRFASTPAGGVYYDTAYSPFGYAYAEKGTSDRSFTGQTQDTTVGLYDFLFRLQNPSQGRWLVPDPAGLAAVDPSNPQTWNRYAYVGNNPTGAIDPAGLCGEITAGIGQGPDTPAGQELIQIADIFGANVAFPYAGQSKFSSIVDILFQGLGTNSGATSVAAQALLATQADARANGTTFLAAGFSGGAQANISASAQNALTPDVSIFVDPGLGIGASLPGNSTVYRTSGITSGLVNFTSPGGNSISVPDCNHNINCAIVAGTGLQQALAEAGPCSNPTIYTRGRAPRPRGGGGAGAGNSGPGGMWVFLPNGGGFNWTEMRSTANPASAWFWWPSGYHPPPMNGY